MVKNEKTAAVKSRDNRRYVSCPVCGSLLSKSKEGTESEQACRRCGWVLDYHVQKLDPNRFRLIIDAQSKDCVNDS